MENKKGRGLVLKSSISNGDVDVGSCLDTWLLRKDPEYRANSSPESGLGTTSAVFSHATAFVSPSP